MIGDDGVVFIRLVCLVCCCVASPCMVGLVCEFCVCYVVVI